CLGHLQRLLGGLRQPAEPLTRLFAQQIGGVADDLPRLFEGARDAEGELRTDRAVAARDTGRGFHLGRHLAHDLARLLRLQALVLAELGLRALRVRVADELVVLRGLALDRGSASLMAASLACLLGHRSLLLSGKKVRNCTPLAQCGRDAESAWRGARGDRLDSRPWPSSSPVRPTWA